MSIEYMLHASVAMTGYNDIVVGITPYTQIPESNGGINILGNNW